MGKVKSKRKASGKTIKRKGTNQRMRRKVVALTKEQPVNRARSKTKRGHRHEFALFSSSVFDCFQLIPVEQKCLS